jgi:tripartite-type tricarboxylate transporter receptor subunit TctC
MKQKTSLCIGIAILVATAADTPLSAQGFKPTKPVEGVVHTGPGGGSDILARHRGDDGEGKTPAATAASSQQVRWR